MLFNKQAGDGYRVWPLALSAAAFWCGSTVTVICDCSGWLSSHIVKSLGTPVSLGRALSSLKKVGAVLSRGRNEAYAENVAHSVENIFLSHCRVVGSTMPLSIMIHLA